jgi:hypothetical protein
VRAEQVTGSVAYHGEGPVWSERWDGLRWVDMLAGDILSLVADGTINRRHVGRVAAALRPRRRGGAVIGVERAFALEDADGTLTHLDELWSDTNVRMSHHLERTRVEPGRLPRLLQRLTNPANRCLRLRRRIRIEWAASVHRGPGRGWCS